MPNHMKQRFRLNGLTVHANKRGDSVEIRYRGDGVSVSACAPTLGEAKERFLDRLQEADRTGVCAAKNGVPFMFGDFADFYFNTFRKRKVSKQTFYNDTSRLNNYLKPYKLVLAKNRKEKRHFLAKMSYSGAPSGTLPFP